MALGVLRARYRQFRARLGATLDADDVMSINVQNADSVSLGNIILGSWRSGMIRYRLA